MQILDNLGNTLLPPHSHAGAHHNERLAAAYAAQRARDTPVDMLHGAERNLRSQRQGVVDSLVVDAGGVFCPQLLVVGKPALEHANALYAAAVPVEIMITPVGAELKRHGTDITQIFQSGVISGATFWEAMVVGFIYGTLTSSSVHVDHQATGTMSTSGLHDGAHASTTTSSEHGVATPKVTHPPVHECGLHMSFPSFITKLTGFYYSLFTVLWACFNTDILMF